MTSVAPKPVPGPTVVHVPVSDPRVRPLLHELGEEYSTWCGKDAHVEKGPPEAGRETLRPSPPATRAD
ncbi:MULTISPECIES: hypothetical protein [unclassified Streptomyces]|uniref:hypothetical protein n=1 Tax=unclassified Streptomyces TaxID=2593676 RepID=UPI0034079456